MSYAPARIFASEAPWDAASHAPMHKLWQAMLYQPGAKSGREYFFYMPDYPRVKDIVKRVELEARWCLAKRFSIRDSNGVEVFDGLTEYALRDKEKAA